MAGTNGDPKKSPALEALERIRKAEERAKAIVQEAREKTAVQIVKEAMETAERIRARALAGAKETADAREKAILERAHQEAETIRAEADAELAILRRQAGAAFDKAVKKAGLKIREILGGGSA
ncbi:MAG: hypothetical protein WBC70_12780 [Candidatus Aminicenantales bacterium]